MGTVPQLNRQSLGGGRRELWIAFLSDMKEVHCAYCGRLLAIRSDNHRDHVFPDSLYASTDPNSKVQRLTIDCCQLCNASWSDDEVQFRNMLLVAGDNPSRERRNLWNSTAMRSFGNKDGQRRLEELFTQMKAIETSGGARHVVYPAKDVSVMRIIKKIITVQPPGRILFPRNITNLYPLPRKLTKK